MMTTKTITTMIIAAACCWLSAMDTHAQRGGGEGRERPSAAEWIERLDKNGDGKVSEDEFDGPSEHFSKFDKNGDGYIEEDEVPTNPPPREDGQGGRR